MKMAAITFGILGGLSMAMGIVTALAVIPEYSGLTWTFWFFLSALLLLITIAFAVSSGQNYE